ncbi:MAG: hypothetical protein ACRCXC_05600, partial [Legionella sp.]
GPPSACFKIDRIWLSVNFDLFMKNLLRYRLRENSTFDISYFAGGLPNHLSGYQEKILLNLQKGLAVCVDGIVTNITDTRDDLKAAKEGDHYLRTNTLHVLIQQFATETLRKLHLNTKHYRDNEIHYGVAYTNYVAEEYGISRNNDKAVAS